MADNRFNFHFRIGRTFNKEDVRETHLTIPAEKEFKLTNVETNNIPLSFSVEHYYGSPWTAGGNDLMYAQKIKWLGDYGAENAWNQQRNTLRKQANRVARYYGAVYGEKAVAPDRGALLEQSVYNALKSGQYDSAYAMAKGQMNERLVRAFMRSHINPTNNVFLNNPHRHFEQTFMVRSMLGGQADYSSYQIKANRQKFYKMFILNAAKEERRKLEFYMYLDLYGCVIYSYLMGVLNTAGVGMTDAQHQRFVDLLYENAGAIFTSTKFNKSYALVGAEKDIPDMGGENIGVDRTSDAKNALINGLMLKLIGEAVGKDLSYIEVTKTPTANTKFAITKDDPNPNKINSHKVLNIYVQDSEGGHMGELYDDSLTARRVAKAERYKNSEKFTPFGVYFGVSDTPSYMRNFTEGMSKLGKSILAK